MGQCMKNTMADNTTDDAIANASPEMQKQWIIAKQNQIRLTHKTKLPPIDCEVLDYASTQSMLRIDDKLSGFQNVTCSISGGSDSDVVLDMLARAYTGFKGVHFVFFDTGVEYDATKKHLDDLEKKYGIIIERERAVKSIPTCCKEFGQPFLSKFVSENIERLQNHGFQWEDESYEVLSERYPMMIGSIRWWCNWYTTKDGYGSTMFNIIRNKWLKEFLIQNPPNFKISSKCCTYAKKKTAKRYRKAHNTDVEIIGVRRAEGGIRSYSYPSCFTEDSGKGFATFRPIFWLTDDNKSKYVKSAGIIHSDCYIRYGLKRTGCVGCPFSLSLIDDLEVIKRYEPNLYAVTSRIFRDSYEYTKKYRQFQQKMNLRAHNQYTLDDWD